MYVACTSAADDLDDLVDVQDRDQQALDDVQPVHRLLPPVRRPPPDHVVPVLEVHVEQVAQTQRARLPVHQRDRVDRERVLQRGQLVQLLQQGLGVEAVLDLDHQPGAVRAVGEVLDVGDALQLLRLHRGLDLLDHLLRPDQVRQLGDHDALAARGDVLDPGGGAHLEAAAAGLVRVPDPVQPDDLAAGRQVRPGDEPHQVVQIGVRVPDQVLQRLHHLDQVVRRHVGRHADRDPGRAVHQQVRQRRRHHRRLLLAAVVVRLEVDDVLVEPLGHGDRRRRHPALGVAHRRRTIVQRPEVAVPVDQRDPHGPGLRHPDQGVVDRAVAVRVELTHHVTDDPGALHMAAVRADPHLGHRVQDPALHRFQPVPGVRQGPGVDHRVCVLQEAGAHLVGDVDVEDPLLEVLWFGRAGTACHAVSTRSSFSVGTVPSLSPY
jgi:hypothetical protein